MSLSKVEKEAVAIGASIGAGCQPCIEYHFKVAKEEGLTDEELAVILSVGKKAGEEVFSRYIAKGKQLLNKDASLTPLAFDEGKVKNLVILGVVIGANAKDICKECIDKVKSLGYSENEVKVAVRMAQAVQKKAAEFTEEEINNLLGKSETKITSQDSCCGPSSNSGGSCC